MQVILTINNAGIKINLCVNVKNWLIMVYVIKDLFGIRVIAMWIDKSYDIGEYLDYSKFKCRKKLFDKLIKNVLKVSIK